MGVCIQIFDKAILISLHIDSLLHLDNKKYSKSPHLNLKDYPHSVYICYNDNNNNNNNNNNKVKYYDSYLADHIQCYHAYHPEIDNDEMILHGNVCINNNNLDFKVSSCFDEDCNHTTVVVESGSSNSMDERGLYSTNLPPCLKDKVKIEKGIGSTYD